MKSKSNLSHHWQQRQRMILGMLFFLVVCVVLVNVILMTQRPGSTSSDLPTAILLGSSLTNVALVPDTPTETPLPSISATPVAEDVSELDVSEPKETATTDLSTPVLPSATIEAVNPSQPTAFSTNPTSTATIVSSVRPLSTSTSVALLATSVETQTPAPLPSSQPTAAVTTTASLLASPSPTVSEKATVVVPPDMAGAVSIDTPLNVGIGQLRIIEATRGAESRIRELGGSMLAAPANQSWVLIEALLVCQDKTSCSTTTNSFAIVGASGQRYGASLQLNITPTLGSAVTNGQMWGYLGFVIPNSEKGLYFVMSHLSQNYVFIIE